MDTNEAKTMTLDDIIEEVIISEGGNRDDLGWVEKDGPNAKGEYHNSLSGVLNPTYQWWLQKKRLVGYPESVAELREHAGVKDIIREFYRWWIGERSGAVDLPQWFQYPVADWFVQSGGHAIKPLQERVGVHVDGAWGPNTSKAVNEYLADLESKLEEDPYLDNEFIGWYIEERRKFIRSLDHPQEKGIMARIDKVYAIAIRAVENNDTLAVPKTYHPDDEIEVDEKVSVSEPDGSPDTSKEFASRLNNLELSVSNIKGVLQDILAALNKDKSS